MFVLYLLLCGLICILTLYFLYWFRTFLKYRQLINEFPGNPANFLLGDVMNFSRDREKLFQEFHGMTKDFPEGLRIWSGVFGSFNFYKAEDFELILSSPRFIEKLSVYVFLSNWLNQGLLTSSGPKWHQRRKILTPAFHFNVLRRFVNIFGEHCEKFVKELKNECNKEKTNVVPLFTALALEIISETAMGVRLDRNNDKQQLYCQKIKEIGELMIERALTPWYLIDWIYKLFPKGKRYFNCIKILHQFTSDVIKERERNFHESDVQNLDQEDKNYSALSKKRFAMLDLLISAKRNTGEIDDAGIREEVDTFMFEGHDTTAMALTFTVLCLANYKDVQDKVRQELDDIFQDSSRPASYNDLQKMQYLDMVIKEVLRLYPSVPFISRTMKEYVPIRDGKYTVPPRCFTHLHIYDLHRDPNVFPDPEKFDPDRFLPENSINRHPYGYVPFSAGPRNCIGQKFAMLEVKSVISSIIRHFEIDPIDTRESVRLLVDLVLRPKDLFVKFKPRKIL